MPPDYRLLIDTDGSGRFERLCAILGQVEQQGSLRRATEALGLSYRYAWGLIRKAEERIGASLLVSRTGGATGGGAELTPVARDLLRRHRLFQQEVATILGPGATQGASTDDQPLLMASTIGPVEAGLVDALVTAYREATGVWIRYVAAGSGQALAVARSGRADLVLVHAPALEEAFIAEGYGTKRYPLAGNLFLIAGPSADPAGVAQSRSVAEALQRIAAAESPFVSRGDQSGTHVKELELWAAAGLSPAGDWYEVWPLGGQGNAATLSHAAQREAYTLVDSATFTMVNPTAFAALYQGDPLLRNLFCLIPVSPGRFPQVSRAGVERFVAWATGPDGRSLVAGFGVAEHGVSLFFLP